MRRNKVNKISRREFIRVSALATAGVAAAACAKTPEEKVEPTATTAPKAEPTATPVPEAAPAANQPPMLADQVKAGTLPALDERIPAEPLVLEVQEEIGEYGGTWRRGYSGIADRWGPTKCIEEYPWEYNPDLTIRPNLMTKWEVNDDASEWTWYMRKGVRWSDGEEWNTDDVKFWYEAVWQNEQLTPNPQSSSSFSPGGIPMEMEFLDNYTFKTKFGTPNILLSVRTWYDWNRFAEHYISQFHPDYGDQAEIDKAIADNEVDVWSDLFGHFTTGPKGGWWVNPEKPVLWAWHCTVPPPGDLIEMARNPYFWQVDPEGNQLPYIDKVTHRLYENKQVFNMWLINGEIDMMQRHVDVADFTLLKENEANGDYRVLQWKAASHVGPNPNQTYTGDQWLADLFANRDFRHALSISINREEVNETVYNGLCEVRQISPVSGSPQFDAEFETKWIEYDPDMANELLDGIGLEWDADHKVRMRPDGKPLQVIIETHRLPGTTDLDTIELLIKYWGDVGVEASVNIIDRALYTEHYNSGDIQIGWWGADRMALPMKDPGIFLGTTRDRPWITLYALWYTSDGKEGVEPPADHPCREIWKIWEDVQTTADFDEASAKFQKIVDIHKEHVFNIGVVGECTSLIVAKNNFRNIVGGYISDDPLRDVHLLKDPQFFIRQS
jgi:peptide/nickel transport system substrate-binding protein